MKHRVGLMVRDGAVDGWVFDLPGCRAVGASLDEVVSLLPVVIAEHAGWLNQHGVQVDDDELGFEVVEESRSLSDIAFDDDKRIVSNADIENAVRQVGFANGDLVALTQYLPPAVLDWRVPPTAVKIDNIYPDVRSIRDMKEHVASAMSFHVRNVGDVVKRVPLPDGDPDLAIAYETTVKRLRDLNEEERSGKVYVASGPRGESEWTARKAFRRILNHQRFHVQEIRQRLAWLTLGVPEMLPVNRE